MEPILRQLATEKNPGRILFSHNITKFEDVGTAVLVTVADPEGKESLYRVQYLVGADGGRTIGPKIGVKMEGRTGITDMVSVHFGADLSEYWDDRYFACHFINGACGTVFESGAIVPMGPTWGKHSEEWVFHFGFDLNDEARFKEEKLIPRIRDLLKIPNLEIKIHKISHWIIERVLADKYREGRILIAGDAAHRRPPTTGLGLNTAIEDSLNLAWKLALVLGKTASEGILDSYEAERRPIGRRNCDWGLFTFENSAVINAAVGLVPGQNAANKLRFSALFEESDIGRSLQAQVRKMIDSQCIEFSAHDIELGFKYEAGLRISDDTEAPPSDPLGQIYTPSTRPGHRLPHAWLETGDLVISTHDLIGPHGGFAVITDEKGREWVSAAKKAQLDFGISITTAQIGASPYMRDYDDQWEKVKGIKAGGAMLIRPDNFVAWRSLGPSENSGAELGEALSALLGTPGKSMERFQEKMVNGDSAY
jgi:2,4-dichlorophenol 6-monooxygenase